MRKFMLKQTVRPTLTATFFLFTLLLMLTNNPLWAKGPEYRFDIDGLQNAANEAIVKSDQFFKNTPLEVQMEMALSYYNKKYEDIASISSETILKSYRTEVTIDITFETLKQHYPNLLIEKPVWTLNNVGGVYARMIIVYCSFNEYVVIWGSQLAERGFSGYYNFMNEWDVMLTGKMVSHDENSEEALPLTYLPGKKYSNLKPSKTRYYELEPFTYMISYARGSMIKALYPGTIAPSLFVSQDWKSLKIHLLECGKHIFQNIKKGIY